MIHNHLAENQHLVPEGFEPFEEERLQCQLVLRYRHPDSRWFVVSLDQAGEVVGSEMLDTSKRRRLAASLLDGLDRPFYPPTEFKRLEELRPGRDRRGKRVKLEDRTPPLDPDEAFIDVTTLEHEDFVRHGVFWAVDALGREGCYRVRGEDLVRVAQLAIGRMTVRELDERLGEFGPGQETENTPTGGC